MLRIEIENLLDKLADRDLQARKDAKNTLYEIEKDGLLPIEILIQQLASDNIIRQIYAIGAIRRTKYNSRQKVLEKYFLEAENFLLIASFIENFIQIKELSFEELVLKKYKMIEKKSRKERNKIKKEESLILKENYILEMLKYLEKFGSSKSHKLLFELLKIKKKAIQFYSLSALSKTNANLPMALLEKIIKETSGTPKYLAQALLDKKNE